MRAWWRLSRRPLCSIEETYRAVFCFSPRPGLQLGFYFRKKMCARDCVLVLVNFNIYQVRLARLTLLSIFLAQSCASMCTSISAGALEKIGGAPGNGPGAPCRTRQIPGAQASASSATGGWPLAKYVLKEERRYKLDILRKKLSTIKIENCLSKDLQTSWKRGQLKVAVE